MKLYKFVLPTIVALSITMCSLKLPDGWMKAGDSPAKYEMGIDKDLNHSGKQCATIQSNTEEIAGFGTLMQNMSPEKYRGKRLKMSGFMRSRDIEGWAGFWMRVDGTSKVDVLSFDNMQSRPVTGTTEWKQYEIVLDVDKRAKNIAFGALVSGTGKLWFDDLKFEEVSTDVPTTDMGVGKQGSKMEPTNLDFEK